MTQTWTHNGLMNDLAAYLRGPDTMVWEDMQLGPSGSPRPDVYTLRKSYSKPMPTAFECKVSRSDLRSDTTSGKWQSYLKFAGSVTFAVPDGLCTVADIPDGCGLIVRKAEVWRYARRPTVQRATLPMDACMKLLIDGVRRVSSERDPQPRKLDFWREHDGVRRKFGDAVAEAARDLCRVNERIAGAKAHEDREYERIRRDVEMHRSILMGQVKQHAAEFEAAKRELADWLGLPADTSVFAVRRAIRDLQASCDADARVRDAEAKLSQARHSIEQALRYVDTAPAGRNAERQDRADGLGPKGEHAVPAQRGGAQPASGNLFDEERAA